MEQKKLRKSSIKFNFRSQSNQLNLIKHSKPNLKVEKDIKEFF